jgi:ACR3 family arsenite efflux pump ArsB
MRTVFTAWQKVYTFVAICILSAGLYSVLAVASVGNNSKVVPLIIADIVIYVVYLAVIAVSKSHDLTRHHNGALFLLSYVYGRIALCISIAVSVPLVLGEFFKVLVINLRKQSFSKRYLFHIVSWVNNAKHLHYTIQRQFNHECYNKQQS